MSNSTGIMTERERIEAVLRFEKPDRVPLWTFFDISGFAAVYHNRPIGDAYRDPAVSLAMQRKACQDLGWVCSPFFSTAFVTTGFGGEVKLPESEFSQALSITRYPIESEDDVWKLKTPHIKNLAGVSREMAFYKLAARESFENEPFSICLSSLSPFDLAGKLCRMENLARWMMKKQEVIHQLLRFTTDLSVQIIRYWQNAFGIKGVLVRTGGVISSNQIISPRQFEQFALPYQKESHKRVLDMGYRHIYCHICGDHNLNLPYWAQVPMGNPGIISIGHEVELETAAKYFPNDIILGNLEPSIVQTGTPEEVYEATRKVIEKGKRLDGRFIFSLGCQLPPRTSLDNAEAMNKAVDDFGWYG